MKIEEKIKEFEKLNTEELMHIEFKIPVRYILKLAGVDTEDSLSRRTTFGWRFEYLGKHFGDYITVVDDIKQLELEELMEVKELLLEQATDAFIHRGLLITSLSEYLKSEIDDRLRDKYYPIAMVSKWNYVTLDKNGKRVYHKKLSFKYLLMVTRHTFAKVVCNLLFKLL